MHSKPVVVVIQNMEDKLIVSILITHSDGFNLLEGDPSPYCELLLETH